MGKAIKKVAPIASVALPFVAPGIGTAIGAALGAGTAAAPVLGNALLGAGLGAASGGGLKGALIGGASAGLGSAIGSGLKVPGLGNVAGASLDQVTGVAGLQGPTLGSGALGSLSGGGGLGSLVASSGGQPVKLGSLLTLGLDYLQGGRTTDDIEKLLRRQAGSAQAQLDPYAQAGQSALQNLQAPSLEALQADPGYQFRLQQGNQALERSLAARGLGQSGAALKAAQQYGQGLADQTYNDYFNRQSSIANRGYGAATGLGNLATGLGGDLAQIELERAQQRSRTLSGLGELFGI